MLQRARASFTSANSHRLAKLRDEYLAVTNLARTRCADDGLYHLINLFVIYRQFEFHFWQEIDDVFRTSIKLSVAFLPSEAFDLCHGNALYPHIGEGGPNIVEFERFNDGDDHFHANELLISSNGAV